MEKTMKITKRQILAEIMAQVENMQFSGDITADDVTAYCQTTIDQLDAKNEKAKVRSAAKKAENDELAGLVLAAVGEEPQTRDQIAKNFDTEVYSVAKIGSRLTKLAAEGAIIKDKARIDGRSLVVYSLAPASDAE